MRETMDKFRQNTPMGIDTKDTIAYWVDICVYLVLVCNFFIMLGRSQDMDILVSWPTRIMVSFVFLLAIYIFATRVSSSKVRVTEALFVGLVLITAIFYLITCATALFGKMVQYMCFMMLPGCLVVYKHAGRVKALKKAVYIAAAFYAFLLIALMFAPNAHVLNGEYGLRVVEELTLGFENPNETAMYLMVTFFLVVAAAFAIKKKLLRIFFAGLSIQLAYMTWQTQSRTCIVLCAVFVALILLQKIFKANIKLLKLSIWLPAIVLGLTMIFPKWFSTTEFLGELIDTGRVRMFASFFENWDFKTALVGNFLRYGGENLHNSFLTVLATFGAPAAVYSFYNLYRQTVDYRKHVETIPAYVAFVGWLMVIAHGISEAALLTAGTVYAGLVGLLMIVMLPEEEA